MTAQPNMTDDEIVQVGTQFGYGHWLQPIINANDFSSTEAAVPSQSTRRSRPIRRGRGRPRVTKPRDESAIEVCLGRYTDAAKSNFYQKRREQVRLAQRSYQKRKETATRTEKRRIDELLQVFSDLSSDVEALLQFAATSGTMYRDDKMSLQIQQLWSSYDTALSKDCVQPELCDLKIKNDQRIAACRNREHSQIASEEPDIESEVSDAETVVPPRPGPTPLDPDDIHLDLVRLEETTLVQSFQRSSALDRALGGRSIFEVVKERQAALQAVERAGSRSSS